MNDESDDLSLPEFDSDKFFDRGEQGEMGWNPTDPAHRAAETSTVNISQTFYIVVEIFDSEMWISSQSHYDFMMMRLIDLSILSPTLFTDAEIKMMDVIRDLISTTRLDWETQPE